MLPWKLFFRFLSAMVLMATGGFAAGHDLPLPMFSSPTEVSAPPAAPVIDPSTTTTSTTTAPVAIDSTTTTTTTAPPVVVVPDPLPTTPPTTPPTTAPAAPAKPAKPATPTTTPPTTAPAGPVAGGAPSVCAAAGTATCGPAPAADNTHAARVQRCQDWWNAMAASLDHNGRPEWAARAREIAVQCEAMITRWEQMDQRAQQKATGDHNGDGQFQNGHGPESDGQDGFEGQDGQDGQDDQPAPPPAQPPAQPQAQPQATEVSHHGEGRH